MLLRHSYDHRSSAAASPPSPVRLHRGSRLCDTVGAAMQQQFPSSRARVEAQLPTLTSRTMMSKRGGEPAICMHAGLSKNRCSNAEEHRPHPAFALLASVFTSKQRSRLPSSAVQAETPAVTRQQCVDHDSIFTQPWRVFPQLLVPRRLS
ncbi:hypothetical protein LIA77_07006 [Sarocladium implicatum]|nr:hypothetical protein LIA77_07006 [Sarocladium implicatum]